MSYTSEYLKDTCEPMPIPINGEWQPVPAEEYTYRRTGKRCPLMAGEPCMGRECALCVNACASWGIDKQRRRYKKEIYRCALQQDEGSVEVWEPKEA